MKKRQKKEKARDEYDRLYITMKQTMDKMNNNVCPETEAAYDAANNEFLTYQIIHDLVDYPVSIYDRALIHEESPI